MGSVRRRWAAGAGAIAVAVAGLALANPPEGGDVEVTTDVEAPTTVTAPEAVDVPRTASLAGPTDGVASRLLPVRVEPSTGLVAGQVVAISGSGFTPGAGLGAVLCSAGAAGGGGVAFCELAHYDNFSATSDGTFSDDYVLRRFITTPTEGTVDCAASTDRCLLAVGNVSDYDESGGSFISFRGAADPPPPALTVSPADGLLDGQAVRVTGTGVRAAPDGELHQCPADRVGTTACRRLDPLPVGPAVGGQLSVDVVLARRLDAAGDAVDCAQPPGCVLATTEYAGRRAVVPLTFVPDGQAATTSTSSTTAPPVTAPPPPEPPPAPEPPQVTSSTWIVTTTTTTSPGAPIDDDGGAGGG